MPSPSSPRDAPQRRDDLLAGLAAGAAIVGGTPPAGRTAAPVALAEALVEEFRTGGVDLHRLAGRWTSWHRSDGFGADPVLVEALAHLEEYDAPADHLSHANAAALAAALPAAFASASPRAMMTGAFHVARLLDPDRATGLAAVQLVLAASLLIEGRRDVIGDVITAMRINQAPPAILDTLQRIAREPRVPPPLPSGSVPDPVAVAAWALWNVQHAPRGVEVLEDLTSRAVESPVVGAIAGALLGARDGAVDPR